MSYSLWISRRAEHETIIAVNYYDDINPDLGERFLNELDKVYNKISNNPEYYSYVLNNPGKKIRDLKVKQFPFNVIFEIRGTIVYVISVMDTRSKPDSSMFG